MSKFTKIITTYATFTKLGNKAGAAGEAYFAAIKPYEGKGAPPALLAELAQAHAKLYGCHANEGGKGWTFHDIRADKLPEGERMTDYINAAAKQQWHRWVAKPLVHSEGAKSHQVDPVAKLLKAYEKLTGAQKRSFKSQI